MRSFLAEAYPAGLGTGPVNTRCRGHYGAQFILNAVARMTLRRV